MARASSLGAMYIRGIDSVFMKGVGRTIVRGKVLNLASLSSSVACASTVNS